ncbi:MAG: hypothetical protein ACJ76Y_21850 [Thermoanaerobaculia bacterium]
MSGSRLAAYVELTGPVEPGWPAALRAEGVEPLQYRPPAIYLCVGSQNAFRKAGAARFVRRVVPLTPSLKSRVTFPEGGSRDVWIVRLVEPSPETGYFERLPATLTEEDQERTLSAPRVLAIELGSLRSSRTS